MFVRKILIVAVWSLWPLCCAAQEYPFGEQFKRLETRATGQWWKVKPSKKMPMDLDVPRDQIIAFALYTHNDDQLKISVQLFPLKPGEDRSVSLQLFVEGDWQEIGVAKIQELGWSAHFRIKNWDRSVDYRYRVVHASGSTFQGLIRKDPVAKKEIVVGSLSCNSSRTPGPRPMLVDNLIALDPDLLFFAGDQSYYHKEHTYGWLEFGMQFREVLKDRPVVTIPDDHDVGQANLWGENGKQGDGEDGVGGGFFYPPAYVNMVQRCQTWHLPDAVDPAPVENGISVYFTDLQIGGIDFAILEDRKFKPGPKGKIPEMGPRPDHIVDADYDPDSVDLEGLELLGARQLDFLNRWNSDWTDAEMKCVLSQTAFCGAVHLHGNENNRLLADLDCNGWPQSGRNRALRAIRRSWAVHLCGDQHLAVVVQHGIDEHEDGPYGFTSPAIVNTIYGRWWEPANKRAGNRPVANSPLPWTGQFEDGLGNKIRMIAYANPGNTGDEKQRGDGFGIARFNKSNRTITFEAWPRFASVEDGRNAQYPGWPVTIKQQDNDGRKAVGYLPTIVVNDPQQQPVVQVVDETTLEIVYTIRAASHRFSPAVYDGETSYTLKVGRNRPDEFTFQNMRPSSGRPDEELKIDFGQ